MEKTKKISLDEFRTKALLKTEDMSTLISIDPPSIWLTYLIYKYDIKITPNQISLFRLYFLAPLAIIFLFLAPILGLKIFYLFFAITVYFMLLSDGMDGHLARGSDQKSDFGAFLDMISDRTLIVITITLFFSLGLYVDNFILVYGSVAVFVFKLFNMTIINKIFFHKKIELDVDALFSAEKEVKAVGLTKANSIVSRFNKVLKIKRWCGYIGAFDRMFLTIIIPALLIFFELEIVSVVIGYLFILLYSYFYIFRTVNMINDYHLRLIEIKKPSKKK